MKPLSPKMFKAQIEKISTFKKLINTVKDFSSSSTPIPATTSTSAATTADAATSTSTAAASSPATSTTSPAAATTEVSFVCSSKSLNLYAFDESQVTLLSLKLPKKFFSSYRCDFDVTFGLNLDNLSKILECIDDDDTCFICFTEREKESITFMSGDATKTKIRDLRISFTSGHDRVEIPNHAYDAIIDMSTSEFTKTCKEIALFDDTVTITATQKSGIIFSGKTNGSYRVIYNRKIKDDDENQESLIKYDIHEDVETTLGIEYLFMCEKASGLAEEIRIFIAKDLPLVIEYKIDGGVFLRYYLAPKIKKEEVKEKEHVEDGHEDADMAEK